MAFVINKSQIPSVFQCKNITPGPGAYSLKNKSAQQIPAPFNTSSYKKSCFQTDEQSRNIGPGKYGKLNLSKSQMNMSYCANSSFKSKTKRFQYQSESKDQKIQKYSSQRVFYPQQTMSNIAKKKNSFNLKTEKLAQKKSNLQNLRKSNHERKVNSIINSDKKIVRVILSNPKNTEHIQSFYVDDNVHFKYNNGPGQYESQSTFNLDRSKSVISWKNYKERRFPTKSADHKGPGPGDYNLLSDNGKQKKNLNKLSSSFSYGGIRSFMDSVIYKTQNKAKVRVLQNKKIYKDRSPGPADYSPSKNQAESFYFGNSYLGSTVQRFPQQSSSTSMPGPGYYKNSECKYKYEGTIRQVRNKIFGKNSSLSRQPLDFVPLQIQIKKSSPVLKQHEDIIISLKERCQSKMGSLAKQQRFKDSKKSGLPGPGYYYNQKAPKPIQSSGVFKSTVSRQPCQNHNVSLVPYYDVSKQDIGYRNNKIKQNIENLKRVEIEKPPFNSKVGRFVEEKKPADESNSFQQYENDRNAYIDYKNFNPYHEKTSYKSVFESTTKRDYYYDKKTPGPGSYEYEKSLEKKSFNTTYNDTKKIKCG